MRESETERGVGYLVKRVQQSLRRSCDAALRPTQVSMAQYAALRALADHPDASSAELARRCFVTRQSLQDLLNGLRAASLVEFSDAPPRGRARALRLTRLGRARLTLADAAVKEVESTMTERLSAAERRQLADLLIQCAESVERS